MREDEFWALIEEARGRAAGDPHGFMDRQLLATATLLAETRDIKSVTDFQRLLWGFVEAAGGDSIREALRLQDVGGTSDDWFEYFRLWLVSLGRTSRAKTGYSPEI